MSLSISDKNKKLILLIVFTFLLKVSLAVYFSYLGNCDHPDLSIGYLAKASGDTFSYIGSVDNLITEGTYYFWNGVRKVYAGRMPYYGAPYFLFRLFFDKPLASDLMVLLQIFFDTLATVYFARLCRDILKNKAAFWFGYILYLLSFNFFQTALLMHPESFSLNFITLFFYLFHRWWSGENKSAVWSANIFLSLAVLLKPYFAPTYLFFLLIYARRERLLSLNRIKPLFMKMVLFGLPLSLMLAPWFFRNWIFYGQPVVTQEGYLAGYNYTDSDLAFKKFSAGWGGDIAWWDAESPACHFKLNPPVRCTFTYPSYSLTDGYTLKDIEDVRADYIEYQKKPTPEMEKVVIGKFNRLTDIYKSERPFMFYIGSSFIRIKTMTWHSNNYNLPIHTENQCFQPYQLLFKVIQSIIYQLGLVLGLIGIIWLTIKRKISFIFLFVPLSLIIIIAFYARFAEARYLSPLYVATLLGLVPVLFLVYSSIRNWLIEKGFLSIEKLD